MYLRMYLRMYVNIRVPPGLSNLGLRRWERIMVCDHGISWPWYSREVKGYEETVRMGR